MSTKIKDWNASINIIPPTYEEHTASHFSCTVVDGKGHDLIYQFFKVEEKNFTDILAEVIDDFFGSTDNFAVEFVPELDSYALLAKNIKDNPLFTRERSVRAFLSLLNETISQV